MTENRSQLKIGIVLNYINILFGYIVPVFYVPVMLRLLGQEEYGLYKLSSGVTSYLSLISLGMGAAITRYLIKSFTEKGKDAEEKTLGLFMIIFRVIAIVSFLVGVFLVFNLEIWYADSLNLQELSRMRVIVFLMVCNTALNFSLAPYISVAYAHERFVFQQSMNILLTAAVPILNLIVLLFGAGSVGMAASSLAIGIVSRLVYFFYVGRNIGIRPQYQGMPTKLLKEIIGFSFWIFVSNIVNQLYNMTDTVMIGAIPKLATTGVAIYSLGSVLNNMICGLTTGMSSLLSPKTNKMIFSGVSSHELTDFAIKASRIQSYIFGLVATGFIAFGRPFVYFYSGEEYADAYWVAILLIIPNMIPMLQSVCLSIVVAQNKHRFRAILYLFIAIANVIGTWFLMQTNLGIIGAALMTGIAILIGPGVVMNWYYSRRTGLEIGRFWKETIQLYIIPIALCVLTLLLQRKIGFYDVRLLFIGIAIYTIVFAFLQVKFVMNEYEKALIFSLLMKFHRGKR